MICRPIDDLSAGSDGLAASGGFVFHPSRLDCCLQLGAAADLPSSGGSPLVTRVPTAAGLVMVPSLTDRSLSSATEGEDLWSTVSAPTLSASPEDERTGPIDPPPISLILDYMLQSGQDLAAPKGCSVIGLTVSPLRLRPQRQTLRLDQREVAVQHHEAVRNHKDLVMDGLEQPKTDDDGVLYETLYLADEPSSSGLSDRLSGGTGDPRLVPSERRQSSVSSSASGYLSVFQAVSGAAVLQAGGEKAKQMSRSLVGIKHPASFRVPCAAAPRERDGGSLSGAMLLGMTKTAALEAAGAGRRPAIISHVDPQAFRESCHEPAEGIAFEVSQPAIGPTSSAPAEARAGQINLGGVGFLPTLLRVDGPPPDRESTDETTAERLSGFRLVPRPPGSLGSLVPEPVPLPKGSGQEGVSVRVRAVGLNFRDLLVVSGCAEECSDG